MYAWADQEVYRQRTRGIHDELVGYRMQNMQRAARREGLTMLEESRWDLRRYAELLMNRIGNLLRDTGPPGCLYAKTLRLWRNMAGLITSPLGKGGSERCGFTFHDAIEVRGCSF